MTSRSYESTRVVFGGIRLTSWSFDINKILASLVPRCPGPSCCCSCMLFWNVEIVAFGHFTEDTRRGHRESCRIGESDTYLCSCREELQPLAFTTVFNPESQMALCPSPIRLPRASPSYYPDSCAMWAYVVSATSPASVQSSMQPCSPGQKRLKSTVDFGRATLVYPLLPKAARYMTWKYGRRELFGTSPREIDTP